MQVITVCAVWCLALTALPDAMGGVQERAPIQPPRLTLALTLRIQVGSPAEIGEVPRGRRRVIPITGGSFTGPNLRGVVLPGGADWQIVRQDGFAELDARYTLQTESGALIYVQNLGIRHAAPDIMKKLVAGDAVDPALVYFKTAPTFETAAPDLQWLTRSVFIATGERYPTEVVLSVWRVE